MKKFVFFICVCLFFQNSFSQNGALYQDWYLSNYEINGINYIVSSIDPAIVPNLLFDQNLEFSGFAACNNYMVSFDYDGVNDFLILNNFDSTLSTCDYQSHDDFEVDYFSLFVLNESYAYSIIFGTNEWEESLELILEPGFILNYQNFPLLSSEDNLLAKTKIYPNPVSETLYISSENEDIETFSIYSITGELILEEKNTNNSMGVSGLNPGLYFVEMISSEGKIIQKFVKK